MPFAWCCEAGGKSQVLCLSAGYELDVLGEFRDFLSKECVISFANVALSLSQRWWETVFLIFSLSALHKKLMCC